MKMTSGGSNLVLHILYMLPPRSLRKKMEGNGHSVRKSQESQVNSFILLCILYQRARSQLWQSYGIPI